MGWFQRLFSGADGHDDEFRGTRSPDQARVSAEDLAGELRALKTEIKLLRESIGSGGKAISGGDSGSRRSRRGGRNRGGRDREADRSGRERGGGGGGGGGDRPPRRSLPKTPPDDAPVGPLVDYLKSRDVVVFEGQDDLNRNEAFEHLARHLGMHFDLLANFYEKVKRCVATGRGQRIEIENYSHAERSAAVQFGTLLHRHGMLKDFYYHRSPKKQLRVIPTKDGQIGQFLTGGWLEIYVSALLTKRLRSAMSPAKFQLLYNVKGQLPDGREFEADLMAAVDGKLFWLECKTGQWQDYSARFRGLVKTFGVERQSGALLLIKPPDASTRARATDMLDMTLLSLDEVDDFISVFLGEEPNGRGDRSDHRRQSVPEDLPPLSEEEIPLENAEPAKKLGRVDLKGGEEAESGTPMRRRRRRRRGGRGRSGGGADKAEGAQKEESFSKAESADGKKPAHLLEPLPISKLDEAGGEGAEAASRRDQPKDSAEGGRRRRRRPTPFKAKEEDVAAEDAAKPEEAKSDPSSAEEGAPRRRRRRRSRKPAAEKEGESAEAAAEETAEEATAKEVEEPVAAEVEVEPQAEAADEPEAEVEAQPEPEPKAADPVKSPTGVTIAPDLAAMMAGSKPKAGQDESA